MRGTPKTTRTKEQRDRDDAKVLAYLKSWPSATRATIHAETSLPPKHVDSALRRLVKDGKAQHDKANHAWKAVA